MSELSKLERLRLEKGIVGVDFQHLAAAPKLTQLELVDFKIVPGFREALKHVKNIEKMLLIPQYMEEVARWDDASVDRCYEHIVPLLTNHRLCVVSIGI